MNTNIVIYKPCGTKIEVPTLCGKYNIDNISLCINECTTPPLSRKPDPMSSFNQNVVKELMNISESKTTRPVPACNEVNRITTRSMKRKRTLTPKPKNKKTSKPNDPNDAIENVKTPKKTSSWSSKYCVISDSSCTPIHATKDNGLDHIFDTLSAIPLVSILMYYLYIQF